MILIVVQKRVFFFFNKILTIKYNTIYYYDNLPLKHERLLNILQFILQRHLFQL